MAGLLLAGFAALLSARSAAESSRITALDVGQGDAVLLEDGGARVLVDTGVPGSAAGASLDLLIITHLERDHAGDAASLLRRARPAAVLWNGRTDAPLYAEIAEAARSAGVPLVALAPGDLLRFGQSRARVLSPGVGFRTSANHNDSSLVLRIDFPRFSALLTGDIPAEVEEALDPRLLDVDVLKVAHHGSRSSTGEWLLGATSPQVALVSAGRGNSYGHPTPEVLARLAASGARVLRTDTSGDSSALWSTGGLATSCEYPC